MLKPQRSTVQSKHIKEGISWKGSLPHKSGSNQSKSKFQWTTNYWPNPVWCTSLIMSIFQSKYQKHIPNERKLLRNGCSKTIKWKFPNSHTIGVQYYCYHVYIIPNYFRPSVAFKCTQFQISLYTNVRI